jgi:type VI protein secretion system component VasA
MNTGIDVYLEELQIIRFELREFAKKYPELGSKLGMSAAGEMNPDIQYLVEAMAYISSRIRTEIESAPRELARLVLRHVSPEVIRMKPCTGLVSMNIKYSASHKRKELPKIKQYSRFKNKSREGVSIYQTIRDEVIVPYTIRQEKVNEISDLWRTKSLEMNGNNLNICLEWSAKDLIDINDKCDLRFYISGGRIKGYKYLQKIANGFRRCDIYTHNGNKIAVLGKESLLFEIDSILTGSYEETWLGFGRVLDQLSSFRDTILFFTLKGVPVVSALKGIVLSLEIDSLSSEEKSYLSSVLMINTFIITNQYQISNIFVPVSEAKSEVMIPRPNDSEMIWDVVQINEVTLMKDGVESPLLNVEDAFMNGIDNKWTYWQDFSRLKPLSSYSYASKGIRLINFKAGHKNTYIKINCSACNCDIPEKLSIGEVFVCENDEISGELVGEFTKYKSGLHSEKDYFDVFDRFISFVNSKEKVLIDKLNYALHLYVDCDDELAHLFKKNILDIKDEFKAEADANIPYGTYRLVRNYNIILDGSSEHNGIGFILSRYLGEAVKIFHEGEMPYCISFKYEKDWASKNLE